MASLSAADQALRPSESTDSDLATGPRLVLHLLAAKRSLASTRHVYRANEIVSEARSCLEAIAVSSARNAFVDGRIRRHLKLVARVRAGLGRVKVHEHDDFEVSALHLGILSSRRY